MLRYQGENSVTFWPRGLRRKRTQSSRRSPLGMALGSERLFFNLELAVDQYRAQQGTGTLQM